MFKGSFVALITPFRNGQVDERAFKKLVDWQIKQGTHGLVPCGTSPDGRLVECIELPDHPFFVASQYHPEFKSRPTRPQPLFKAFVGAAARRAGVGAQGGGDGAATATA